MKNLFKLLLLAMVAMAGTACDNQHENELNIKYSNEFEFMLNEYGTFDLEMAPELFSGKRWTVEVEMECDKTGKMLRVVWAPDKKPAWPDGTTLEQPMSFNLSKEQKSLKWEYDPSRGIVTIGITEFRILAISKDSMVWVFVCEDSKGAEHYYQQLLKPQANGDVEDLEQDARTLLTCYSGLYDLVAHTGELHYMTSAADRIIEVTQEFSTEEVEKLLTAHPWHQALRGVKQLDASGNLEWIAEKKLDLIALWYDMEGHSWNVHEFLPDGSMTPIQVGVPPHLETLIRQWRYDPESNKIHLSKPNEEGVYEEYFTMPIVGMRPDLLILQNMDGFGNPIYEFCVPYSY